VLFLKRRRGVAKGSRQAVILRSITDILRWWLRWIVLGRRADKGKGRTYPSMSLRRLSIGLQVVVTGALLALLFRNFDWTVFRAAFSHTPLCFYLVSFGVLVAGQALYIFKWGLVLGAMGLRVPFWRLAEQYLLGTFFDNFLPTMIGGEAACVYYLGREEGYTTVATSVFVDRGLGFLSLAACGSMLVWWLDITTPAFIVARKVLFVLLVVLVATLATALTFRLAPVVLLLRRMPLMGRVAEAVELVTSAMSKPPSSCGASTRS
jgi:uncharacterized membrane protein YbhN (UPF0104 family)